MPRGKVLHLTCEESRIYQHMMEFYVEFGHMPSTNMLSLDFQVNRSVVTRRMQSLMTKGFLRPIDPPMGYAFIRRKSDHLKDRRRATIAGMHV